MKNIFFTLFWVFLGGALSAQELEGRVTDQAGNPLVAAYVWLLPDSLVAVADSDGRFSFGVQLPGIYQLRVQYLGYHGAFIEVKIPLERPLVVVLEEKELLLSTVEVTDEHAKMEEVLATEHLSSEFLERNRASTFAKTLERAPGISAINTGVGIAKPVIRGLSANRVIVTTNGIKQEGHQWGADHGLEIDPFAVERVEIIKGPSSLQYGSDGLGGVINVLPDAIPATGNIEGEVQGVHKTNNQHWGGAAKLAANHRNFFLIGRFSYQNFADFRVPADSFVYRGFGLPIEEGILKNTAGRERNWMAAAGILRSWGSVRFTAQSYSLQSGLFSGAVGIPRAYALTPDGNRRDVDIPYQAVDHLKLSLTNTILLGRNHIYIALGYQNNLREEHSFPEFHSLPQANIGQTLALQLRLQTWSAEAHLEHLRGAWKRIIGLSGQMQANQIGGFELLLPNFRLWRAGIYQINEYQTAGGWHFSGGLRLDAAQNRTDFASRFVFTSDGGISDTLSVPATDDILFNWSASLGANKSIWEEKWAVKAHLGKSFRVPYPSETASNGVHHGTFRHEQGTPDLESEHGLQLDLSSDWTLGTFEASLSGFANYFQNFIYLQPSGTFSTLPEAGQIYRYVQNDAFYSGGEASWEWKLRRSWEFAQGMEYVWNINLDTRLPLPFTPPGSVWTECTFKRDRLGPLHDLRLSANFRYTLAQNRVDRNEDPTPAYYLLDMYLGFDVYPTRKQKISFGMQGENLFDTPYLNHLSRYRLISIPEQGRNWVFYVKWPIGLKK